MRVGFATVRVVQRLAGNKSLVSAPPFLLDNREQLGNHPMPYVWRIKVASDTSRLLSSLSGGTLSNAAFSFALHPVNSE